MGILNSRNQDVHIITEDTFLLTLICETNENPYMESMLEDITNFCIDEYNAYGVNVKSSTVYILFEPQISYPFFKSNILSDVTSDVASTFALWLAREHTVKSVRVEYTDEEPKKKFKKTINYLKSIE